MRVFLMQNQATIIVRLFYAKLPLNRLIYSFCSKKFVELLRVFHTLVLNFGLV